MALDYRTRIYEKYASVFKGDNVEFNTEAAERYGAAFSRYLVGWLPEKKDAAILDLACGSGRMLYLLKQKGYTNLAGVDLSAEQVALARQITDNVAEGDIFGFLAAGKNKYDLIFAQDIIEHVSKDDALNLLDACHAALVPGGRLILSTPNAESPACNFRRYGDFTHEICFTPPALGKIMELTGFEQVASREDGPYCHGVISGIRVLLWEVLRGAIMFYNLVEVGHTGSKICTRDFLISAIKPSKTKS